MASKSNGWVGKGIPEKTPRGMGRATVPRQKVERGIIVLNIRGIIGRGGYRSGVE